MRYICSVCGYVYDESRGIPEARIPPDTSWEELGDDWRCPLCGAGKKAFKSENAPTEMSAPVSAIPEPEEPTPLEISALCSSLAKGCMKQNKILEAEAFSAVAEWFRACAKTPSEVTYIDLEEKVFVDLTEGYPLANAVAARNADRGAMRSLVWSEKVSRILASFLEQYEKEKSAPPKEDQVYVCSVCGYVWVGDEPPLRCPVCGVPNGKFERVEG